MKTVNQNNSTVVLKAKFVALLVMVILSSGKMVAQNTNIVIATAIEMPNEMIVADNSNRLVATVELSENANMNLCSWFMGTKQTPNTNLKNDDSNNVKKQMINSGIEPNRLLIKSFLKKMSSYNQVIV